MPNYNQHLQFHPHSTFMLGDAWMLVKEDMQKGPKNPCRNNKGSFKDKKEATSSAHTVNEVNVVKVLWMWGKYGVFTTLGIKEREVLKRLERQCIIKPIEHTKDD